MTREDPLYRVPVLTLRPHTTQSVVHFESFGSQREKTEYMKSLAMDAEQSQRAHSIALAIAAENDRDARRTFEALHYWRCKFIAYQLEESGQTLQSADHAIVYGRGDCTAQSIVAGAFATALERAFDFVTFGGTPDDSEHITAIVLASSPASTPPYWLPYLPERCPTIPGWWWTDTSVPIGRGACVRFNVAPACPVRT